MATHRMATAVLLKAVFVGQHSQQDIIFTGGKLYRGVDHQEVNLDFNVTLGKLRASEIYEGIGGNLPDDTQCAVVLEPGRFELVIAKV